MRLEIVDVFAEAPLKGNQLAVVDASDQTDAVARELTGAQMQSIAREMNFSETSFITKQTSERGSVRIFTPDHELPFAGHPTLGTAWVLGRKREADRRESNYILDLEVGPVEVSFDAGDNGICWMSPPLPKVLGAIDDAQAASLLNLPVADLDANYPATFIELGPQFAFIPVSNEEALARATVNLEMRSKLLDQGLAAGSVFAFCKAADTDYAARLFFDAGGIREDPATGSANSAFAVYLRDQCGVVPGQLVVAQGDYIQRPSRIYLDIREDAYRVGGRVHSVATGELANTLF